MSRSLRLKLQGAIYHIMSRSISDIPLFRNSEDKKYYLNLIKKYMKIYRFKIYAYCIMDTHVHLLLDSSGADISDIMHCINQCYAQHFNRKYKRRGPVFSDRFKSKIVDNDIYLNTVSGYIHNNPKDIPLYTNNVHNYEFSSFGIYLGIMEDIYEIVDPLFILNGFGVETKSAQKNYLCFVEKCDDIDISNTINFKNDLSHYDSSKKILSRNYTPKQVVNFVADYTSQIPSSIHIKYSWKVTEIKSLSVLLMRSLCNFKLKDICSTLGNITISQVSKLSSKGMSIIMEDDKYKNIIEDFIARNDTINNNETILIWSYKISYEYLYSLN